MATIKIIVAHHKKAPIVSNDSYLPIHVGKKLANIDLGIDGDDTGDNISIKNPIYCEMSALYWAWKNLKADYLGLCHYRRYFTQQRLPLVERAIRLIKFWGIRIFGNIFLPGINYTLNNHLIVNGNQIMDLSQSFTTYLSNKLNGSKIDLVVPHCQIFACQSVRQHFEEVAGQEPINLLEKIAEEKYPKFYPFLHETLNSNKLYAANMFVMRYSLFHDYSKLIFDILEEHEYQTVNGKFCSDILKDKCYSRLSGYLAECLTSAFILQLINNKRSVLYVNTLFCKDI